MPYRPPRTGALQDDIARAEKADDLDLEVGHLVTINVTPKNSVGEAKLSVLARKGGIQIIPVGPPEGLIAERVLVCINGAQVDAIPVDR